MKHSIHLFLLLFGFSFSGLGQTSITMTLQNISQPAPNIFEYDVVVINTGSTSMAIRGYSAGINHAPGMAGGGTLTHSFISRDASLSTIPAVSAAYTASANHIRLTTVNATTGNEVPFPAFIPLRIATMRITNTVAFPTDFNPAFSMQTTPVAGRTQCIVTAIVTPPGSNFVLNGAGNNPVIGSLQVLTGTVNLSPCFRLNPSGLFNFTATTQSVTHVPCYGQQTGTVNVSLNYSGTGSYSLNSGTPQNYSGNSINLSGLSAGSYVITVTPNSGCNPDTAQFTIIQPEGQSSVSACAPYFWQGNSYTASGVYSHTFSISSGCDSVHFLNLTILPTFTNTQTITAANQYTWAANNVTYTNSGTYVIPGTTILGCDSTSTLILSIFNTEIRADQDISCHGANDGTMFGGASGTGNFRYDLDNANLFTNTSGYFFNVAPGIHTVCIKELNSGVVHCGVDTILEPDPLFAYFSLDSPISCITLTDAQLSIQISGGSPFLQPYLTVWTNSNGDTLNEQFTNNYATTLSGLGPDTYQVRIEDDNGCVFFADTSLTIPNCGTALQVKLFIQGYYDGSQSMVPVLLNQGVSTNNLLCDTLTVELHDQNSPYGIVSSQQALLQTNGLVQTNFTGLNGTYYLVIRHRNGLQTWSAAPLNFNVPVLTYDFSISATQAYGSNQVEVEPGVWALYSGDLNSDENTDLLDNGQLETDINAFGSGYLATDLNGDGNVDLLDGPVLEQNILNFIFSQHP